MESPFVKEGGFTTAGVAIALLLVFALVFASMHAYWVGTRSGDVQYVADAGALAADNVVAQYMTVAQTADAVLLTLSLVSITVYAVSAVVAFIPGAGAVAENIASAGGKLMKLRGKFSKSAAKGLNAAQKVLPALCAVKSAQCVQANASASNESYVGFALALPSKGIELSVPDGSAEEQAAKQIEDKEDDIQEQAKKQEEAQKQLDEAKKRAWEADCGAQGMCMRERASHLAGLSGSANPMYSSAETWSFSVALERAKAYYQARYSQEPGASYNGSPEEIGESVARERFYEYALDKVSEGSVSESGGIEDPDLKELARNTSQIRETYLYTEAIYPVSVKNGKQTIHAYAGCPVYLKEQAAGVAAVSSVDSGTTHKCEQCNYSATTLGRVPSASTSINNGFEYYYRKVVEASEDYKGAADELKRLKRELKQAVRDIAKTIKEAFESLAGQRIDPQPPGRYGCICIVASPKGFAGGSSGFYNAGSAMWLRVAISGATLAADPSSDEGTVVSDLAQGLAPASSLAGPFAKTMFAAWGDVLRAYAKGKDATAECFKKILGAVPVVGTDLSDWAAGKFKSAIEGAGLREADLSTYKPVLVNTSHILRRDASSASNLLLGAKSAADAYGSASVGDWVAVLDAAEGCPGLGSLLDGDKLTIAKFALSALGLGSQDTQLSFPVPQNYQQLYEQALQGMRGVLQEGGS